MKILIVLNPNSGQRNQQSLEQLISDESAKINFEYKIYKIEKQDEEQNILKEINQYKPDIVAAAGGDGTVNLITKIIVGTEIALLIIPLGSANGMAKELGIAPGIESSIGLLTNGVVRKIDLLKINGQICVHLADVGLNARIVKRFEQDPRRGIITYAKYLYREIFLLKKYRFYIRFDGKETIRKAISLTFANASKYGTGAVINPLGKIDDGKFELVIIKPFPKIKLLSITWKIFMGTLQTSEYVEVISCSKATVWSPKKTTLQIDGEVIGKTREITIEILPKVLKIIVPPKAG